MSTNLSVEPWLRGTHGELDALRRQVLHALELTGEDGIRWCSELSGEELNAKPFGLPSVGFQMKHIAGSLDRLLTYAEGSSLTAEQHRFLATEAEPVDRESLFALFEGALADAMHRVLRFGPDAYEEARFVGRDRLPTTAGGLLIHCAEHTQRHSGQMVTTAKVLVALRDRTAPVPA